MLYKRGAKTDPWGTPFFKRCNLLCLLSPPVDDSKASVLDELHDHTDHVPIMQEPQQLAGEAAVPYCVVCCCQVYKHGTGLLFCLKAVLKDVLSKQNYLVRPSWSTADFPRPNPACSLGSSGSMISSTRA